MNKADDKIIKIIKMYRRTPDCLDLMINEKKAGIENNERVGFEKKMMQYDLSVLEEALKQIKILSLKELVVKIIPIVISLYFVITEIIFLDRVQVSVYEFGYITVYLRSFLIFVVIPAIYIEKIGNYFLGFEPAAISANFFYKAMYLVVIILMIIELFESLL
ncbi:hypothetical protein KAS31_00295 [Candidatus Parcubacteria bacterium]|nr:hypothetical protein [Candidatus Parcubacteria bacterium]